MFTALEGLTESLALEVDPAWNIKVGLRATIDLFW